MTEVNIYLNGAGVRYVFDIEKSEFLDKFNNDIAGIGFYIGEDIEGKTVIINPHNCSTIKINSIKIE